MSQILILIGAIIAGLAVGTVTIAVYQSTQSGDDDGPLLPLDPVETATATTSVTTPTATSTPETDRCIGADDRIQQVREPIVEIMDGYDGTWGFAMIDVDCGAMVEYPADYSQYPASSWKIVIAIAALRAVESGDLELADFEEYLELVMQHSLDAETDAINRLLTFEHIQEVTAIAGVSPETTYEQDWRYVNGTPADLARIWAALLRGDLLSEEWTDYLLELAETAEFPPGYETFPPAPLDVDGYQYGQKAGFYISEVDPHYLVGAGYIRPEDGRSDGFALVFMAVTPYRELEEPRRWDVFPILEAHVLSELEPAAP